MLLLGGIFRLCGDLLAFIGPWCIEIIVEYAYKEIEKTKNGIQNGTIGSNTVTYSPLPAGNSSNTTLPPDSDASVSTPQPLYNTIVRVHSINRVS